MACCPSRRCSHRLSTGAHRARDRRQDAAADQPGLARFVVRATVVGGALDAVEDVLITLGGGKGGSLAAAVAEHRQVGGPGPGAGRPARPGRTEAGPMAHRGLRAVRPPLLRAHGHCVGAARGGSRTGRPGAGARHPARLARRSPGALVLGGRRQQALVVVSFVIGWPAPATCRTSRPTASARTTSTPRRCWRSGCSDRCSSSGLAVLWWTDGDVSWKRVAALRHDPPRGLRVVLVSWRKTPTGPAPGLVDLRPVRRDRLAR